MHMWRELSKASAHRDDSKHRSCTERWRLFESDPSSSFSWLVLPQLLTLKWIINRLSGRPQCNVFTYTPIAVRMILIIQSLSSESCFTKRMEIVLEKNKIMHFEFQNSKVTHNWQFFCCSIDFLHKVKPILSTYFWYISIQRNSDDVRMNYCPARDALARVRIHTFEKYMWRE